MKKFFIFLLMLFASTSLMAQNVVIKMINNKEFKITNQEATPTTVYSEVWLNGEYVGKAKFDSISSSFVGNIDNWRFVKEKKLNVVISNIKLHTYEKGDQLPNNEIEDMFLTLKQAGEVFSEWRIYLRGD
jgi:hypothetical protein